MVTPAQPSAPWAAKLARLKAKRLTPEERDRALTAMEDARAFHEAVLARRGGKLLSRSWEILNELRDERSEPF